MTKINAVWLKSYRSFAGEALLVFPDNGLVLIDGINNDTGGSSGSGKTSIAETIAYALGYSKFSATDLKCRQSDSPLQVVLTVQRGQGQWWKIYRGKENRIDKCDGQGDVVETITGATAIDEALKTLFGLPMELVEALTYRPQRSFGRFVSMTDSEKKEFLTNCLPELTEIERVAEAARVKSDDLYGQAQQGKEKLLSLSAEYKRHEQNNPALQLKPVDIGAISIQMDTLVSKLQVAKRAADDSRTTVSIGRSAIEKQLEDLGTSLRMGDQAKIDSFSQEAHSPALQEATDKKLQLEAEVLSLKKDYQTRLSSVEDSIAARRTVYLEFLRTYDKKQETLLSVEKIKKEIEALNANLCPTCQRQWEEAKTKIVKFEEELSGLLNRLLLIEEAGRRAGQAKQDIGALEESKKQLSTQDIDLATAKVMEAVQQIENLRAERLAALASIRDLDNERLRKVETERAKLTSQIQQLESEAALRASEAAAVERELVSLSHQLDSAKKTNAEIAAAIEHHKKLLAEVSALLSETLAKIQVLEKQLLVERAVAASLGRQGYMGSIFDEILAEISAEVTSVLERVPNVSSVSLKFVSESTTKKGTSKRSIVPIVTKDGVDAPLKTLSGGQQASVELAVDLAVASVIGRRTGRTPGWLILDEAFDGLDIPAKESIIWLLKRYAHDRLIMIIDHASEIKEAFDKTITVSYKNGLSTII